MRLSILPYFLFLCVRGLNNFKLNRDCTFHLSLQSSNSDSFGDQSNEKRISHISRILSRNLASVNADKYGKEIAIDFGNGRGVGQLTVVTGESGSGKSLLVSKVAELLIGGKAGSLLHGSDTQLKASAQIEFCLYSSHITAVRNILESMNMDTYSILGEADPLNNTPLKLTLKRSLSKSNSSGRIKSSCKINDHGITLKALKAIGAPLLAIVNAQTAAMALSNSRSRMTMFDTGIPVEVVVWVRQLQRKYIKCRKEREKLEKELRNLALPVSANMDSDRDLELFDHWLQELDGFEARVSSFCQSISSVAVGDSPLQRRVEEISDLKWMDSDGNDGAFSSSLYRELLELLDYVKELDSRIEAALEAQETLSSLSFPKSARTALERTRQLTLKAGGDAVDDTTDQKTFKSAERAHELLNHVEDALSEFSDYFDSDAGLLSVLQSERSSCPLSPDDINEMIFEWNTLARKHGISAYLLPSCQAALRSELDENIEAKMLLPTALEAEKSAFEELQKGTKILSKARFELAKRLSNSITNRLPLLGMENSSFEVRLRQTEEPSYSSSVLGVEEIDFLLRHENADTKSRGGNINLIASSGEKARILLAIECEIPGSVRALCGSTPLVNIETPFLPPVAVIYDEIDAHVGGRASVSMAKMLSEQSRSCQVVSITHSPSVAAIADLHICINRQPPRENGSIIATATAVDGSNRRKELARMASGDMATEEAFIFADALIRDAAKNNSKI